MRVRGEIDAYIKDAKSGVIVKHVHGCNTFTNVGKQHVCDWLLHDNYTTDVPTEPDNAGAGGRSISNYKVMPYTDYTVNKYGSHAYTANIENIEYPQNKQTTTMDLYNANSSWSSYTDAYGQVVWEFTEPKDICGMLIWGFDDGTNEVRQGELSTSPNPYIDNTNWTRQKLFAMLNTEEGSTSYQFQMFWFDYYNEPGRILEGVKSLRYRCRYEDWTQNWTYWYGVWFFEPNFYPSTPSVVAIGTDLTAPDVTDTALGAESLRRWVRSHKAQTQNDQVTYSMRLERDEANGTTFNEIGLFFNPDAADYIGGDRGPDTCTSMFARGLFDTPWSKEDWQIVDVDYTVTLIA